MSINCLMCTLFVYFHKTGFSSCEGRMIYYQHMLSILETKFEIFLMHFQMLMMIFAVSLQFLLK